MDTINGHIIDYPRLDSSLSFAEYIAQCRTMIEKRRTDLAHHPTPERIITANSPFEFHPSANRGKVKYGALLIHGLFDCPFSLRDIGKHLHDQGMLCRSILLPGHGTKPDDLLHIAYDDWIQAVKYGIASLRQEVEHLYLIGFSTGALLSVHHALLQDNPIAGLILLAPAIKIKAPIHTLLGWRFFMKWVSNNHEWIYREDEVDYTKYLSIAFNPVSELNKLTDVVNQLHRQQALTCPVLMIVSREDETISSHGALDFFCSLHNQENKLLLYTSINQAYRDTRIVTREAAYLDLHIKHFSHVSIPFLPNNPHYGQEGDYIYASHIPAEEIMYGSYNRIEEDIYNLSYRLGITKNKRRQLTYNPDFHFMVDEIVKFITK